MQTFLDSLPMAREKLIDQQSQPGGLRSYGWQARDRPLLDLLGQETQRDHRGWPSISDGG
jgi:hypothetical protein